MTTSNFDLIKYAKTLKVNLRYIGDIKNIPQSISQIGSYIFLVGGNNGHWVGLHITKTDVFYFDSFGEPPNKEIEAFIRVNYKTMCNHNEPEYYYNSYDIQSIDSTNCGLYVLDFLQHKINNKKQYEKYISKYTDYNR